MPVRISGLAAAAPRRLRLASPRRAGAVRHTVPIGVRAARLWRLVAATAMTAGLAASWAPVAHATVPGPNGRIALHADTGSGIQIYTVEPDGTGWRQLTPVDGNDHIRPHWSPDSSLIAFELDTPTDCHVAYMRADGSHTVVLPLGNGQLCEGSPSFSPDGARLYYEAYDGHRDVIMSMALDGSDRRFVSACTGQGATDPEVSPDGTMVSMTCFSHDGKLGESLYVANIDGSHLRRLTPLSLNIGIHEDWAPDSSRIMFLDIFDEGAPDARVNTATVRPDGTDLRHLTSFPSGGLLAYGNSFSPDGRFITLRIEDHGSYALYQMRSDGSGLTQITPFSDFRPRNMAWGSAH